MPPPILARRHWNDQTAAHLLNRAGFGATPRERANWAALDIEDAVDKLLQPSPEAARTQAPAFFKAEHASSRRPDGMDRASFRKLPEEERRKRNMAFQRSQRQNLRVASIWWLERMRDSDFPLEEKLTLFWHGHFATSFQKVRAAYPMLLQNMSFREKGRGHWPDLIEAVAKDPAMLNYLDNARSNKKKPNENFARELMELFTLGEGHYSEDDIRNAARALTGWSMDADRWEFKERPFLHDQGNKRFFGESGRFDGRDIIDLIVKKERSDEYLVERLWSFFAGPHDLKRAINDLAPHFRKQGHSLQALLRAMFLHPSFYAAEQQRTQIKSPVMFCVNSIRLLEGKAPPTPRVLQACRALGQELYRPPSVKGWDGGSAWITGSTLALRYQSIEQLLKAPGVVNPEAILPDRKISRKEAREQLFDRFFASQLRPLEQQGIDQILAKMPPPSDWNALQVRNLLNHILQQPQYQLI